MERRNETVGRIVAAAWSDTALAERLLADTHATLAALGIAVPAGKSVATVQNTQSLTYIVLPSPRYTETASAYAEIKAFGESYRDPRYAPLDWISRDPVFAERFDADPVAVLQSWDVAVASGMTITVVRNTIDRVWLVLPAAPPAEEMTEDLLRKVATGWIPPAIRYACIEGAVPLDRFASE